MKHLKKSQKKFIINIAGLTLMALFLSGFGYLIIFNDPITETEYDTGNPNTSLIIREHTKTGEKDYIYGVVDGIGQTNP